MLDPCAIDAAMQLLSVALLGVDASAVEITGTDPDLLGTGRRLAGGRRLDSALLSGVLLPAGDR